MGSGFELKTPAGERLDPAEQTVHLAGGPWGASLVIPVQFAVEMPGVYWFDVVLSDRVAGSEQLLTRIPLEVIYTRSAMG